MVEGKLHYLIMKPVSGISNLQLSSRDAGGWVFGGGELWGRRVGGAYQ